MYDQPFTREQFGALLNFVATNAKHRWPSQPYLMTSDVAWQFPGCGPKDNIRLWYDTSGVAGYAWFQPPDGLLFDVRPDSPDRDDVTSALLDWALSKRSELPTNYPFYIDLDSMDEWAQVISTKPVHPLSGNRYLTASAFEDDTARTDFLERNGFEATKHHEPFLTIDLSAYDDARQPDERPLGITLRHVTQDDYNERVAVHAASWAPAASFTMDRYLRVRAINAVFDPELDLVAVTDSGEFASYTIAWQDPVSLIGSFEPFGTRPAYRGTGVSEAVIDEGLVRLKAKGMHFAKIHTAGFNHSAARLYERCGFTRVASLRTFLRTC